MWGKFLEGLRRRLIAGKQWVYEGKVLWVWLIVAAVVLAVALNLPFDLLSDRVRWAGIFFELIGVATVAVGLIHARKSFDKRSMLREFLYWLGSARFMIVGPPTQHIFMEKVTGGEFVFTGSAVVLRKSGGSAEDRLTRLETQTESLEKRINEVAGRSEGLDKKMKQALET